MRTISKNNPPTTAEINIFLKDIDFSLPSGFINFFKESNGADITTDEKYIFLWALTEMVQLNKEYRVEEYAPDFFIFGSDGGDTAYTIERNTGYIYEMPFIGMLKEDTIFICQTFTEFIENL